MNETNSPKRLTRSRDDRFIGGVAAGIARYFNLDPVLIRIAFVLSIALGGIGVIAYLFLLALVPIDGDQDEPVEPPSGLKRFGVIAGTVVVGIIAIASIDGGGPGGWFFGVGPGPLFGVVIWGLAIYGVYWLVRKSTGGDNARTGAFGRAPTPPDSATTPTTHAAPPTPATKPEATDQSNDDTAVLDDREPVTTEAPTAVTTTMAASPTQNAPVRPTGNVGATDAQRNLKDDAPSTVGRIMIWVAIGIAALIGFSILAAGSTVATAVFGAIPMASLVILLGGGLIFAAIQNRRKVAIVLLASAAVIAIPMAAVSIADLRIEGSYGERTEEPRLAADIPEDGYRMAAGVMTLDLRNMPFQSGSDLTLPVHSGMGATRVIVPDNVCVTGQVDGKAGLLEIRGTDTSGVGIDQTLNAPVSSPITGAGARKLNRGKPVEAQLVPGGVKLDADFKLGYFEVIDATDADRLGVDVEADGWDEVQADQPESARTASRDRAEAACFGPVATTEVIRSGVTSPANG